MSIKLPMDEFEDKLTEQRWLKQVGVTGLDMEMTQMETDEDVQRLKKGLRLRFPLFITNVCRILLYRGEEKLACLMVAYFEVALDRAMFRMAVDNEFFDFLKYLFIFRKNYVGRKESPGARRNAKAEKLDLTDLFKIVIERNEDNVDKT